MPTVTKEWLYVFAGRFVETDSGCWEWQGFVGRWGYGALSYLGHHYRAHRLSLSLAGVDIEDKLVCHHCDNKRCIRPSHLYAGSALDNARDAVQRTRRRYVPRTQASCHLGHALNGGNLYVSPRGRRACRTCINSRARTRRAAGAAS